MVGKIIYFLGKISGYTERYNMNRKKRIIMLSLAVILAAGIGIFAYQKANAGTEESPEEGGHFIETENPEEEIEYADISKATAGDKVRLGDFEGEMAWDVLDEKDGNLVRGARCGKYRGLRDGQQGRTQSIRHGCGQGRRQPSDLYQESIQATPMNDAYQPEATSCDKLTDAKGSMRYARISISAKKSFSLTTSFL